MGLFSRKKKVKAIDWWDEYWNNNSLDYDIRLTKNMNSDEQFDFNQNCFHALIEIQCLVQSYINGLEADIILTQGLFVSLRDSVDMEYYTNWDDVMKLNHKVAKTIPMAFSKSFKISLPNAITKFNLSRIKSMDKYSNTYVQKPLAAAINRYHGYDFKDAILSELVFYILNELEIEADRSEKKELFDYFDLRFYKAKKTLAQQNIIA